MAIASTLSIVINVTGTDTNGNTINQTINVPPVANTGEGFPTQTPLSIASGANAFNTNAATFGYKMLTIVPPLSSSIQLYLGSSTAGQQVTPTSPICFGINGITTGNLFVGGSGLTAVVQAIFT